MADFQDILQNPVPEEEIIKDLEKANEKEYLKEVKKRNEGFLLSGLGFLEKERIARWVKDRYNESKDKHKELCDKMDEYDEVYRMTRKEVVGSDGEMPNYRSPTSTVALEVVHSNVMNVFFTPKDLGKVLPTEEGDVGKVAKLSTYMNWSMKNELDMFEFCDRLFHGSSKNGEAPYIMHWVKEYGIEIVREIIPNPADPSQPLMDEITQEPLYIEKEEPKLLYNGPKLEAFSRKDYIQPLNAMMGVLPDWEMRIVRYTRDEYLRAELEGKMYSGSMKDIIDWEGNPQQENDKEDYDGDSIPVGKYTKEFIEFYGRMRIKVVKSRDDDTEESQELEEEFIAVVNLEDEVLGQLRKNKFPLKKRPVGMDYFLPDDEGRRAGIGMIGFMEGIQKSYDIVWNQYIDGVTKANSPFGFFTPMGGQKDEPIKIQNGFLFPTSDPSSVNIIKMPPPDQSIQAMLELITGWAQILFGISAYSAGVESTIDPDAPAKKAQLVVQQGNVRLNTIIRRKNKTIQDILFRWYLLCKDNMPPNKFMRVAGVADNPWKFEAVNISDFALKSIPDFELTGNILNVNKAYTLNKTIMIYNMLVQNMLFNPATRQGLQAYYQLTKWLIDNLDETGLSSFLPAQEGETVQTPEEENARFLQGDSGEPTQGENHMRHIQVHRQMITDATTPDDIKEKIIVPHIQATIKFMQEEIQKQAVMQQLQKEQGGPNANIQGKPPGAPGTPPGVAQAGPPGVERPQGGVQGMPVQRQ